MENNGAGMSATPEHKESKTSSEKNFCPKCGRPSGWWGACDDCVKRFEDHSVRLEVSIRQANLIAVGLVPMAWVWYGWAHDSNQNIEHIQQDRWNEARLWAPRDGNLYMSGPSGVGKTFAAACILTGLVDGGPVSVAVVTGLQLAHYGSSYGHEDALEQWRSVDVLLIDDIDKGNWNPRTLPVMHYVFDGRATGKHPTIITSNIPPYGFLVMLNEAAPDYNKSYVDAIAGRLNPCTKIAFGGESLRGKLG